VPGFWEYKSFMETTFLQNFYVANGESHAGGGQYSRPTGSTVRAG